MSDRWVLVLLHVNDCQNKQAAVECHAVLCIRPMTAMSIAKTHMSCPMTFIAKAN